MVREGFGEWVDGSELGRFGWAASARGGCEMLVIRTILNAIMCGNDGV